MSEIVTRPARPGDAAHMARLADMAGEGLPSHLWAGLAQPGESVWEVGARRAVRDEGAFSWRNASIAEIDGRPAGMLLHYRLPETPEPLEELTPLARPLQMLENRSPGGHYINILAVYPEARRRGVAGRLIGVAAEAGAREGAPELALIVSDGNAGARAFYAAAGFTERARETLVPEDWKTENRAWILLVRPL